MEMAKKKAPELVELFSNLLWANLPNHWVIKTVYFRQTLFVSVFIENRHEEVCRKVRRSFTLQILKNREDDLWGLARDCTDEMKTEAIS